MSEATKIGLAVLAVFAAGFIMVGLSKEEPSTAQKEAAAGIRNYVAIQTMANEKCPVLFSPVYSQVNPTALAEWVLADKLPVRMQVQLHKILWGEKPGV